MVTIDLETTETKFDSEPPMAENILEPQKSPISTDSHEGNLTLTKFSPSAEKEPVTPKLMETSIEKKAKHGASFNAYQRSG